MTDNTIVFLTEDPTTYTSSFSCKSGCPDPLPTWRKVAIALAVVFSIIVFLILMLVNTRVVQTPGCVAAVQPPPVTFMVVWTILFICVSCAVGFATYYACRPPARPVPILILLGLFLLVALLASWTFVDAQQGRKAGAYMIGFIILVTLFLIVSSLGYGDTKVPALFLTPLAAWTLFALVLAATTAKECDQS